MSVRVLIVDDEPVPRERLRRLLEKEADVEIVGDAEDGRAAVEAIEELHPDLVFLDIQMPELDGLGVARTISEGARPLIVFVTAYDQYALQAFDVNAADYLLKPFDAERFRTAFRRARQRLEGGERPDYSAIESTLRRLEESHSQLGAMIESGRPRYIDRILVRTEGRAVPVRVRDVEWFEAAGNYVRLHTSGGAHLVRETLAGLQSRLDPRQFQRIHRKTIVNLDAVRELQTWFSGDYVVILRSGAKVRLSRYYRDALQAMGEHGNE